VAEPLWTLGEILSATGGTCLGVGTTPVTGFSIDSRSLGKGEGFVAIRGPNRDGHAFVAAALDAGAACAVVDGSFPQGDEERLVRVGDTLAALNDLGRAARARATHTMVIAVTGSVGKTGSKEALRLALQPSGSVHASVKSFNNHWGVPLSLANMPKPVNFGVFEAGMNHAGEIDALTRLIRPHIAIITTVAPVHLGFFRSVEEIADAKAEIFRGLEPGGTAIINRDSPYYERLKAAALAHGAKIVGFGETRGSDALLLDVELLPDGSQVTADILGETVRYRLGAPGRHLVQNSLAVLAAVIWAVYVVLQARYVSDVDDTTVAALTLAGGSLPLLIFGFPSMLATHWSAQPLDVWMSILYGGVISLALASVFWYRGVRILGATRTGIYLHFEPVFALIAAWIWMHEHPTPLQGVGAVTILAGVTLTHT